MNGTLRPETLRRRKRAVRTLLRHADWLGLSDSDLAGLVGVTPKTVRRWKDGSQTPSKGAIEEALDLLREESKSKGVRGGASQGLEPAPEIGPSPRKTKPVELPVAEPVPRQPGGESAIRYALKRLAHEHDSTPPRPIPARVLIRELDDFYGTGARERAFQWLRRHGYVVIEREARFQGAHFYSITPAGREAAMRASRRSRRDGYAPMDAARRSWDPTLVTAVAASVVAILALGAALTIHFQELF